MVERKWCGKWGNKNVDNRALMWEMDLFYLIVASAHRNIKSRKFDCATSALMELLESMCVFGSANGTPNGICIRDPLTVIPTTTSICNANGYMLSGMITKAI